jgi:hypothetical protein
MRQGRLVNIHPSAGSPIKKHQHEDVLPTGCCCLSPTKTKIASELFSFMCLLIWNINLATVESEGTKNFFWSKSGSSGRAFSTITCLKATRAQGQWFEFAPNGL